MSKTALLAATAIIALTAGSASGAGLHPMLGHAGTAGKSIGVAKPLHSPSPLGGPGALLYSQNNGGNGGYINSQNFTSGYFTSAYKAYDDAAADDFVMPSGSITGGVTEVDVSGTYSGEPGPINSETISFYTNKAATRKIPYSHPNKLKFTFTVNCVSAPVYGDLECALPYTTKSKHGINTYKAAAKLRAGDTYWVSVVANMHFLNTAMTGLGEGQWFWDTRTPVVNDESVWMNPNNGFGDNCFTFTPYHTCFGSSSSEDLMFAVWG